jgi:3-deoxy-D-manno-octulosonate 8-phosphate phosphatase (KDO 8-P phosphatase)
LLNTLKLIVFDCDGVLTDGSIYVDDQGHETKRFFVRDGFAMKTAPELGLQVGVMTGRGSRSVAMRMNELGVVNYLPKVSDKGKALLALCDKLGVSVKEAAFVGDDLIDIPAMTRCGFPVAVADAAPEVKAVAHFVTQAPGGRGAAREAIEHILKAQDKWQTFLKRYHS